MLDKNISGQFALTVAKYKNNYICPFLLDINVACYNVNFWGACGALGETFHKDAPIVFEHVIVYYSGT